MTLHIRQFPCLSDNYGFLLHDDVENLTACIDTPEADAINQALTENGWQLTHILNTHHHWDHTGANLELKSQWQAEIWGPAMDARRIPGIDRLLEDRQTYHFGEHPFRVVHAPGHTTGHILFHFEEQGVAFVGDTIFAMGCGRMFEGTPQQFAHSLATIAAWPAETVLYCAHEYTQANADFALSVDAENPALIDRARTVRELRRNHQPTVPTTVAQELATNPFMRLNSNAIKVSAGCPNSADDSAVFAALRAAKDQF